MCPPAGLAVSLAVWPRQVLSQLPGPGGGLSSLNPGAWDNIAEVKMAAVKIMWWSNFLRDGCSGGPGSSGGGDGRAQGKVGGANYL